jgi:hypothetical protein
MKQEIGINFEVDLPKGLKEAVLQRIEKEKAKKIFRQKVSYSCGFFVSVSAILFSVAFFGKEILASDFWSISALAFTDMKIVAVYWQEYALSLLETFPFEAFAFVLMSVFSLLLMAKKYSEQQNSLELKFN